MFRENQKHGCQQRSEEVGHIFPIFGTRAGAIVPENMEALISRTLGYAPGTFVIQEEVNEAAEED